MKLTLDILELMIKSKINFFNCSFLSNLLGGGHSFFNIFKEGHFFLNLGNPGQDIYNSQTYDVNNITMQLVVKHVKIKIKLGDFVRNI